MINFTFIFEYEGGTYIKQVAAAELNTAINLWSGLIGPEIPKFYKNKKSKLAHELQFVSPVLLDGMKNVWFLHLEIGNSFGYLNIVATL